MVSFQLSAKLGERLDALALAHGMNRSRMLRTLVEQASMTPADQEAVPGEVELMELLGDRARAGNVQAIKALLAEKRGAHGKDKPAESEDPFDALESGKVTPIRRAS